MGEAKPTPGVWKFRDDEVWLIAIDGVSVMGDAEYYPWVPPNKADWLLFVDAGNTYNTTGLTPSQLVERVKELEGALSGLLEEVDLAGLGNAKDFGWPRVTSAARAALSKARPNTAEGE